MEQTASVSSRMRKGPLGVSLLREHTDVLERETGGQSYPQGRDDSTHCCNNY